MASPANTVANSSDTITVTPDQTDQLPEEPAAGKHGWAGISTVIRNVDAERIRSCNDEIDALLTFAGLYSAALTAFLVESYKGLTQDPQDTMIFLLQQLVVQTNSFVINDRFINSTFSHPMLVPTFVPTSNIKRINGLWFASLILALMCASFSIVVKQWLRELIPTEQSSPRRFLRIRHFRTPGIESYRVFEIVALLPFLIHLALLLFFIGLCLFTATIHRTIEFTTIGFVAAWAFFLIATAFVPAVDPTCPYKTPLIQIIRKIMKSLPPCSSAAAFIRSRHKVVESPRSSVSPQEKGRRNTPTTLPPDTNTSPTDARPSNGPPVGERQCTEDAQRNHEEDDLGVLQDKKDDDDLSTKEALAASTADHDVDILVRTLTVDVVQADDELLRNVMFEALFQANISPHKIYEFPFAVIDARLQRDGLVRRAEGQLLDMRKFSNQSYTTISYMLALLVEKAMTDPNLDIAESLEKRLRGSNDKNDVWWLEDSIRALLCPTKFTPPSTAIQALYSCLACRTRRRHFFWLIRKRLHLSTDKQSPGPQISFQSALTMLKGELAKERTVSKLLEIAFSMIYSDNGETPPGDVTAKNLRFQSKATQKLMSGCKPILRTLFQPYIKSGGTPDIKTLACIDAVLLDDQFLKDVIWTSLQPDTTRLSELLTEAVSNRTRSGIGKGRILNLEKLDETAYSTVMELAAQFVDRELTIENPNQSTSKDTLEQSASQEPSSQSVSKEPSAQITSKETSVQSISKDAANTSGIIFDDALESVVCVLLSPWKNASIKHTDIVNRALQQVLSDANFAHTARLIKSNCPLDQELSDTSAQSTSKDAPTQSTSQDTSAQSAPKDTRGQGTLKDSPTQSTSQDPPGQGAPRDTSAQSTPKDAPTQSTSQDTSAQSAPKDTRGQGTLKDSPTQSTSQDPSAQGASQDPPAQSTSQDPPTQSTSQDPPGQGAPRDTSAQSTPKDAPTQSTSQDTSAQSAPKDTRGQGTLKDSLTQSTSQDPSGLSMSKVLQNLHGGFVLVESAVSLISFIQHVFPPSAKGATKIGQKSKLKREVHSPTVELDETGQIAYNIPDDYQQIVLDLFLSRLQVGPKPQQQREHRSHCSLLFETVFQLWSQLPRPQGDQIPKFVRNILSPVGTIPATKSSDDCALPEDAAAICDIALNAASYPPPVREAAQELLAQAANTIDYTTGLSQILAVLQKYHERRNIDTPRSTETAVTAKTAYTNLDALLTFRFYLQLLKYARSSSHHPDHYKQWEQLLSPVLPSLGSLKGTGVTVTPVASECLDLIYEITVTFNRRGLRLPFQRSNITRLLRAMGCSSANLGQQESPARGNIARGVDTPDIIAAFYESIGHWE